MDTFDNNAFPDPENQPPVPQEPEIPASSQPEQSAYHGTGTGRKESPYANSPYVMNHQNQQSYQTYPPHYEYQAPQKPKKERKPSRGIGKKVLACVLALVVIAGSCGITAACVNEAWEDRLEDRTDRLERDIRLLQQQLDTITRNGTGNSVSGTPAAADGLTPGQVYAQNVDSVVAISTTIQTTMYGQSAEGASSGSGFILTEDGYVVTNYHVVQGATSIEVVCHDGTSYPAELVGYDSTNDLAVLNVEATGLPAATVGSSSNLIIGDMVVAIGNPLGELTATQTVGYVSGINREITTDNTIISMIQTDAAINAGNSGGPLFNMYGEVIGITTAKYSGTTGSGASIEGIGFAIPIDDVMSSISDLIDYGYVTGAYLGVTVQNTDANAASVYGLPTGAQVMEIVEGASADRAGLKVKDIIIQLGDTTVSNVTELTRALRSYKAGDTTTITVIRGGTEVTLDITLDEKPQDLNTQPAVTEPSMPSSGSYDEWFDYFRRYFGG